MRDEEKMHVTITLDKHVIMHIAYWIVIIALGVLLVLSWLDDCSSGDSSVVVDDSVDADVGVATETPEEPEEPTTEPEETCTDDIKNQDETDVDCGGSCGGCEIGETCKKANDCTADYCVEGACTDEKPIVLSGDVDLSITKVKIEVNDANGAAKVTSISYKIDNGLDEDLGLVTLKVYLKSKKDGTYCLSQIPAGTERDCANPYATWTVQGPDSGEIDTNTQDLGDVYFGPSYVSNYGSSSYYQNGDDFQAFLYMYDENGNLVNGKEVSAFRTVSP